MVIAVHLKQADFMVHKLYLTLFQNIEVGATFRQLSCAVNNPKRHVEPSTSSSFLITD